MRRPCLCGDPYCGSCGDPSLAQFEAVEEKLMETLVELKASIFHYELLVAILPALVEAIDKIVNDQVRERMADDQMYISYLKDRVEELERAKAREGT